MTITTLSLKDILRKPTRSLLTICGLALASATLFSLLAFSVGYKQALQREMANSGIHMLVSTEGCPTEAASLALHGGEIPKFLPQDRVPLIRAIPGIRAVTAMLIFSLPGENNGTVFFYGVDDEMLKLKPHWKLKGTWFKNDHSIILGAEAARVEKRDVGDKVFFPKIDTEFTVTGILDRTGSEDDGFFFIPLQTAQKVFHKEGKLTGVGVHVNDLTEVDQVKERIERIPEVYVVTAGQMIHQIMSLVNSSKTLMFSVLIIALVISAVGVLNTVLMSVMEKMREFAYMRCVGASPAHIARIVLTETLTLSIAGAAVGVTFGILGSSLADQLIRHVLPYAPAGKMVVFNTGALVTTIVVILTMGAVAGLYPSWKAAQAAPMEAIRNE